MYRRNIMTNTNINTLKPHVSINVTNIAESVEFYKSLFGIEPMKYIEGKSEVHSIVNETAGVPSEKTRVGYAKFDVENPPLNFVLNEVSHKAGGSLSHLGIQVATTDDVLKTRERWIESGLVTVDEMKVDCCYALQDKTWARDPDGNEWEVFVVLENTEPDGEACACGTKVDSAEISTSVCCTASSAADNIAQEKAACC